MNQFDCCTQKFKIKYQLPVEVDGKKVVWTLNEDMYNKINQILSCNKNGKLVAIKQENGNMILSLE